MDTDLSGAERYEANRLTNGETNMTNIETAWYVAHLAIIAVALLLTHFVTL